MNGDQLSPRRRELLEALRRERRLPARADGIPRREPSERAPMSFSQQRLWYLDRMLPGASLYLVPVAYRLQGPLDHEALVKALNELVARHESLRTTFAMDGAEPVQLIAADLRLDLPVVDCDGEDELWSRLAALAVEPMDLSRGPLLRGRLLRRGPEEHVLLLTFHHAVADDWSLEVFNRELGELYAAHHAGRPVELPEPAIQYPDFAIWQREWSAGPEYDAQLSHWRRALEGAPQVLELLPDRPRPPAQSFEGRSLPFRVEGPAEDFHVFCRALGATPAMVLLAAFQVLLARYTGHTDIVVGTPIANRDRAELEGLIGFLTNTVVIRTDVSGNPSFAAVVARVREAMLDAHANQGLPFEKLVEALRPERHLSRSPLFQMMFIYQQGAESRPDLDELTVTPVQVPCETSKFDLTLAVRDGEDGIEGSVEYSTDLFDEASIRALTRHFGTLLAAAVADAATPVWELPILSPVERERILVGWNQTDQPIGENLVHRMFTLRARAVPDAVAVVDEGGELTYRELDAASDEWARALQALGVGRGSLVGICLERSVEFAVAFLAVLKAGGAYVPLDPAQPKDRLAFVLDDTQAALLLTSGRLADRFAGSPARVVEVETLDGSGAPPLRESGTGHDDLAYVIYTSGSTGRPKGVMVTHRGLANYAAWARDEYAPVGGAPVHSSVGFDLTVTSMLVPLLAGGTVHLLPEGVGAEGLGEALLARRAPYGLTKITPAHLEVVAHQLPPHEAAGRTRSFVIGGESLLAENIAFWRRHAPETRLINEYGPTETTVGCATYEVSERSPVTGAVPIGRPIANTRLYVLDPLLNPVPVGVAGELHVGGAGVARGYLNRPGLTAERFLPDPFSTSGGERMYRTGDIVRYRADGNLEYLGRQDTQVKLRGFRVELGEIEAVMTRLPAVAEVAVTLREDTPGDRRLVAYVVESGDGDQGGAGALREALRAELPDYMVPSAFVVLDALPLTANGKVDRAALPAPSSGPVPEPARDNEMEGDVEGIVAGVWRTLLGRDDIGAHDNFFEAGGHSLLLLAVHGRLVELFGDRLTVTDLFRHPTIRSLADFLVAGDPARATVAVKAAVPSGGAIAVIGMACRFPGARTPEEFWRNIDDGVEAVQSFSDEEILSDGGDPALLGDPAYVKAGTVLADIDRFDAGFFDLTPREAEILDPQHRLFLECSWEALEYAGYDPHRYSGQIGVFAGSGRSTYLTDNLLQAPEVVRAVGEYQLMLSTEKDFLPTRVSYKFNLRGPSISVNTACSTSLVAIHLAGASLRSGECDLALAGGARVEAAQRRGYLYQVGGIESPDGHCRPFDVDAQGTFGSSGVGVVALKRLEDAIADGDVIHAVIRGSAVNNDGARKVGYVAPAVDGQAEVIERALAAAGVSPGTIDYIETHGTATPLGDPIEVAALAQVYGREETSRPCALGSVKSNIGHTDAAAGVAGLIKTVMALKDGTLPASLNFSAPNPRIDFDGTRFYVNTESRAWPTGDGPRRAAVSSFGMGGTNAHVILEEAPRIPPRDTADDPELLVLSARTPSALDAVTERLGDHLRDHPEVSLASAATTLRLGRRELDHRRTLVSADRKAAVEILTAKDPQRLRSGTARRTRGVAFVFPGQGSQYPAMGAGLYRREGVFRATVDLCSEFLRPHLGLDLRDVLYAGDGSTLQQTWLTQPALFVTEYALARHLMEWGVRPAAMAGHSIGEYVAACLAGVFSVEDALRLVSARGRLVQDLPSGAMLAVPLPETEVRWLLDEELSLAAVNGPALCVVAGPHAAVAAVEERLSRRGVTCRQLRTSHAFHSSMLDPVLDAFAAEVGRVSLQPPRLPYLSNVTGSWVTAEEATDPAFWARHLRETVRFGDCARILLEEGHAVAEVGPGRTLATFLRNRDAGRPDRREEGGPETPANAVVTLMRHLADDTDDLAHVLDGVGRLWLAGVPVDWARLPEGGPRVPLPTYPFERRRHWVQGRGMPAQPAEEPAGDLSPLSSPEVAAGDATRARVAAVWEELFGITPIGDHDDFFELGGHSLLATQLVARLRSVLGVEIPIEAVFKHPTVARLAASLPESGTVTEERPESVTKEPPEKPDDGEHPESVTKEPPGEVTEEPPGKADDGPLPLSFAQRRIWFLDQMYPDQRAYTIAVPLELEGELDERALQAAVQEIVHRHEVLRTTFPVSGGEPVQLVAAPGPVELPVIEVPDMTAAERVASELARTRFDLAEGPVFLPTLLRVGPTHHVLSLNMHHIVSDGWSMGIMARELGVLYNAFAANRESPLGDLSLSYGDYTRWQRERVEEVLEPELAYWTRQLAGAPPALELPTDKPRPPMQTFDGAVSTRLLPLDLTDRLRGLSREHGLTLYMTLLGALQTLLYRYTGQSDICVGSPVAGRTRAEHEELIGCFLNTLVLRTRLDGQMSFGELLPQVRETALNAYACQDVPFERLVDALNLPRDPSRNPLFQVMFNLMNLPSDEVLMDGLRVRRPDVNADASQVDLGLYVYEVEGGLDCHLKYNTDLFEERTVERMLGHFETLLEAFAADPSIRLADVEFLTPAERREQLVEWNVSADDQVPACRIHELVERQADRTPEAIAITFDGLSLTYRQLDRRANRLAHRLRSLGVGPDVLVGVAVERSQTMMVALLAVLKAGGAYVPLDPMYPRDRRTYILENSGAAVLITQEGLLGDYGGYGGQTVLLDADIEQESADRPEVPAPASSLAYIIYTSGSTGRPKGVAVPHSAAVNLLHSVGRAPGMKPSDTLVAVASFAFDISVLDMFLPLSVGARVVIATRDQAYDATRLAALMAAENATFLQVTPATWHLLVSSGWQGIPGLKAVTGGDALPAALAADLLDRTGELWNMYGPTETTIYSTGARVHKDGGPITIGPPIANTQVYVLDPAMRLLPVGAVGEIHIGGLGVTRGYLGQPDVTADRFVPDPYGPVPGARLYRSGDLGRFRPDGTVEFVGRNDAQVKVRGFRIELGEIETQLLAHPTVRDAVVVVREEDGAKEIVAYLRPHPGQDPVDAGEWRTYLRRNLPDYMVPTAFVTMEDFPLTPNGKVNRQALPAPDRNRSFDDSGYVAPRTPLETALVTQWAQVLGVERLGIDDNFFDLGGDSFKAVRAVRGNDLSAGVLDLFNNPTVRSFAEHAGERSTPESGERSTRLFHELTPPRAKGDSPLTIVCLPFAGAGAIIYRSLAAAAPSGVSLYALEPPGHDVNRPDEPMLPMDELLSRCVEEIKERITGPLVLYGHCMGGAMTVALAERLESEGIDFARLFIGGHFPAPRLPGRLADLLHRMFPIERRTSKRAQLDFLRAMGFFTDALTDEEQAFLMRVFFRDVENGEDYYTARYRDGGARKLAAPIVSVIGTADRATELYQERFREWEEFSDSVSLELIEGAGHYFQKHQAAELMDIITSYHGRPDGRSGNEQARNDHMENGRAREERAGTPPARTSQPSLRTFSLVAAGQIVSVIGTGLTTFAMGLWVYQRSGSISLFALTTVLALLPAVVLAPVAGTLADRWDRRKIMIFADTFAAVGTLGLGALYLFGHLELWHIFVAVAIGSCANAFQQPAYLAAVTQLVPKRYYGRANGITQLGSAVSTTLAPLLGGALAAAIGLQGIILIDLVSFLVAVTINLSIRFPDTLFVRKEEPFGKELIGGWRYISRRHGLMAIIGFTVVLNFMMGMVELLATPLALSLGDTSVLGMVLAASGVGLLVGSALMAVTGGLRRRTTGILGSFGLIGLSMVVMGLWPHPVFPALGLFGIGLATAGVNTHWLSIVQAKVGLELQGRVIATTLMLSWMMVPAGFLLSGPLAEHVFEPLATSPGRGIALLMITAGVCTMLLGLAAYRYRPVRLLEDDLPDVIPDAKIITDKDVLQELADRQLVMKEGATR
ncbi:hybrid non-ribosomal peptide synthetase/type I polyketide synthase [Streptosporangium amethystogenes]|uniref:hybrid non-ribosomal peptide synthetase/type I polyketide synthase n=1 Tax=Streptosporangium amethystogenes TaxID=2002 RepID=UPI000A02E552|nr:hybrid non-ribosomal peptide synthetase/type I polyketide synthase [Streptosporangium amethystogenes]